MTLKLNLCAPKLDMCFQRGDTLPFQFALKDSDEVPVNITGFSFLLTVDPELNPASAVNNLFQLSGTIVDAPNGIVQFGMTALQADQPPGTYFHDVQMTDGVGKIRTVAKGKFKFEQDVTK